MFARIVFLLAILAFPSQAIDSECISSLATPKFRNIVLVEGAGDVTKRFYGPAYKKVREQYREKIDFVLYCADDSRYWKDDPKRAPKMRETWAFLRSLGITVLDKSVPEEFETYKTLAADTVIVANIASAHAKAVMDALQRPHPPKTIFVEKVLDSDLDVAMDLMGELTPFNDRVWAYDHYRARVTLDDEQIRIVQDFLGGHIKSSTFYFLEDRSGADATLPDTVDKARDGAAEIENRVAVLNDGVVLDLMSHFFPLLRDFGQLETIRPTEIKAARYKGVDGDPDKPTDVVGETYASFKFVFQDRNGNLAEGAAFVGKGVRGVRALGPEFEHNAKLLEFVGANGNRVKFDLRSKGAGASMAYLVNAKGKVQFQIPLNADPYAIFLDKIADRGADERQVALNVEQNFTTLKLLDVIRRQIARHGDKVLLYPGGMRSGRMAPYMEELEAFLPPLLGKR